MLTAEIRTEAETYLRSKWPEEGCAFVVETADGMALIPVQNRHPSPREHFLVTDAHVAEDAGCIVAFLHSHVAHPLTPSAADEVAAANDDFPWYVVGLSNADEVAGWFSVRPSYDHLPLENREYVEGVWDCWALVRDFYEINFDVTLPDFPRHTRFWDDGLDLLHDRIAPAGFAKCQAPYQRGDLFLMRIGNSTVDNHLGVYLGDGEFLHHPYLQKSRKGVYGKYWQDATSIVVRRCKS